MGPENRFADALSLFSDCTFDTIEQGHHENLLIFIVHGQR